MLIVIGLLLVAVLVLLVMYILGRQPRPTGKTRAGEDALDILARRYARGEISKEEYDEMRRALQPEVEEAEGREITT